MKWWEKLAASRPPDYIIGQENGVAYMRRWWIYRTYHASIYLHEFMRSDDDRALHDHPWWSVSYLLRGSYTEVTISAGGVELRKIYSAPSLILRSAKGAHRIELHDGPCWTLFMTGPVIRSWGFHCPKGWRPWQAFCKPGAKGEIGPGCE